MRGSAKNKQSLSGYYYVGSPVIEPHYLSVLAVGLTLAESEFRFRNLEYEILPQVLQAITQRIYKLLCCKLEHF